MNPFLRLSKLVALSFSLSTSRCMASTLLLFALLWMNAIFAQVSCTRKEFKEYSFSAMYPYDSKENTSNQPNLIYSCYVPLSYDPAYKVMTFKVRMYAKEPNETERQFAERLVQALPSGAVISGSFNDNKITDYGQSYRTISYKYKEGICQLFMYFRRHEVVVLDYIYSQDRASELNEVAIKAGKMFYWDSQPIDVAPLGINISLPHNCFADFYEDKKIIVYRLSSEELAAETEAQMMLELQGAPTALDTAKVRKAMTQELAANPSLRLTEKLLNRTYHSKYLIDEYVLRQTEGTTVYDLHIYQVYMDKQLVRFTCRTREGQFSKLKSNCINITGLVKPL
jgi:hypothetical protein